MKNRYYVFVAFVLVIATVICCGCVQHGTSSDNSTSHKETQGDSSDYNNSSNIAMESKDSKAIDPNESVAQANTSVNSSKVSASTAPSDYSSKSASKLSTGNVSSKKSSKTNKNNSKKIDTSNNNKVFKLTKEQKEKLTRTYVSMPSDTEEQQFEIIKLRILSRFGIKDFPAPEKVLEFSNTPNCLWAVAEYKKDKLEDLYNSFNPDYDWTEESNRLVENKYLFKETDNYSYSKYSFLKKHVPLVTKLADKEVLKNYETIAGFTYYDIYGEKNITDIGSCLCDTSLTCIVNVLQSENPDSYYVVFSCLTSIGDDVLKHHPELYGD